MSPVAPGRGVRRDVQPAQKDLAAALPGTRAARNSQARGKGIGQELVGKRVALPRRCFVPGSDFRDGVIGSGAREPSERRLDLALLGRQRGFQVTMDRNGRRQIGAVTRQLQDVAAAEAKADRGAAVID